ncbi:MAG: DUF5666 domain-containing protein [Anaerolineae bacterium]|nr:DUF5666 domain-containing protein [Anaerolineae bacterium]
MNRCKHLSNVFNNCLDRLLAGKPIAECLEGHEAQGAEIRPLLATVAVARRAEAVPPRSPQAVAEAKADFLAAAAARRREMQRAAIRQRRGPRLSWPLPRRAPAWATVSVTAVLVLALLTGTAVAASARSLPGDFLYPVKRVVESAQLSVIRDPAARETLQKQLEQRRLEEVQEVIKLGRVVERLDFSGVIEALEPGSWVIGHRAVLVDERTEVEGVPALGARAWVEARVERPGELVALRIRILAPPPTATPVPAPATEQPPSAIPPTATCTATATPPTQTPAAVSRPTRRPPVHTPEPSATPEPPPTLAPTPTATTAPTATPTPVPPTPTPPRPVAVRIVGLIESMAADRWVVAGRTILLTGATVIDDTAGQALVGALVAIRAEPQADGTLVALHITVQEPVRPEVTEFSGLIERIAADSWTVGGQRVEIGPQTNIQGEAQVGRLAHVRALSYPDGRLLATRIVVEQPELEERFVDGPIESLGADTWTVAGVTIVLDAQTVIAGQPELGRRAQVQGYLQADGSVLARHIRVLEPTVTATAEETPTQTPTAEAAAATATPTPLPGPTPTAEAAGITPTATTAPGQTPTGSAEETATSTPTAPLR